MRTDGEQVQGAAPITIGKETDSIYLKTADAVTITGLDGDRSVGTVTITSTTGSHDCVVWYGPLFTVLLSYRMPRLPSGTPAHSMAHP